MFLWWGTEDLVCFYNDAYRPSLGENGKHPNILGMKAEEAWPEIWDTIKPLIDGVLSGADAPNKKEKKTVREEKDEVHTAKLRCDSFIADEMWAIVQNIITELAVHTGSTIRGNTAVAAFYLGHLLLQWHNLNVPMGTFERRTLDLLSRNQSLKGCSSNSNKSDGVALVEVLRLLLLKWRTRPPSDCVCGYIKNNCCYHLENRDAWMCNVCTERLAGTNRDVPSWDWLKSVQKINFSSSFLLTIMD